MVIACGAHARAGNRKKPAMNAGKKNNAGMIVPAERSLFGQGGWAVLLSFEADGYVEDDAAMTFGSLACVGEL